MFASVKTALIWVKDCKATLCYKSSKQSYLLAPVHSSNLKKRLFGNCMLRTMELVGKVLVALGYAIYFVLHEETVSNKSNSITFLITRSIFMGTRFGVF